MTLMLASVTGAAEAEIALEHGADIIDLKDPSEGALRALPLDLVRAAVAAVAGRRPVGAVAGDLAIPPDSVVAAVEGIARTGRLRQGGLVAGTVLQGLRAGAVCADGCPQIVAVVFADREPDVTLLSLLAECGFAGAMLDTAHKASGRCSIMPIWPSCKSTLIAVDAMGS